MKRTNSLVKVAFFLDRDEDGYPPVDREDLWAAPLEKSGRYAIDNIPFYVPGIALHDTVTAEEIDGCLVFSSIFQTSGHSTVRVIVYDEGKTQKIRDELARAGCSSELSNIATFFAVDVPPEVDYQKVLNILIAHADKGDIDYEESALRR